MTTPIKAHRLMLAMTPDQVARIAGIEAGRYRAIEERQCPATIEEFAQIQDALDYPSREAREALFERMNKMFDLPTHEQLRAMQARRA